MARDELRPYQTEVCNGARQKFREGHKRGLIVMPTGSGKTHCIASIIESFVAKAMAIMSAGGEKSSVLFLCGRKEILNQTSRKLDRVGVDHGVIQGNHPRWRPHCITQVVSFLTLLKRLDKPDLLPKNVKLIVVDEAHHGISDGHLKIYKAFPNAIILGATATPWGAGNKGLGEVFEFMVLGPNVKTLIEWGNLVPFEGFAYDTPDLSGVKKRAGDYDLKLLDGVMNPVVLGGAIIRDYLEHAKGLRALAFAVNVAHSKAVVEQALSAGIPAEHVDDDTHEDIREAILGPGGRLETGETLFVSQVGICVEGVDVPAIQCVIFMRPTSSRVLSRQMPGRGLRPWCFTCKDATKPECRAAGHDYKKSLLIHDHAGLLESMGLPDEDVPMSLEDDAPPKPAPTSTCKKCLAIFPSGHTTCPRCGAPIEIVTGLSGREIKEDADARRLTIEEIRARRKEGMEELSDADLMRVHKATREEKAAEYLRLIRVRDERGFKEGFASAAYRSVFGVWPKFDDEFLAGITPATRSFIPYKRR